VSDGRAIVVGGGVAGLAAAYELLRQGREVSLYEAGDRFGGQVRTFEIGGGRIEAFYHHLFRSDHEIGELIADLGLGEDLDWTQSRVGLATGNRIYPFVGAGDLLRFDRVSLLTRLRLGLAALWLRRQKDWRRYEGQRARDWIVRAVGQQGYDAVWGPLLRAKFGAHADEVSMVWFWSKIYLRFASRDGGLLAKERLGYLSGSFGRLIDALVADARARGATLEVDAPVERIAVEDGRVVGVVRGGELERADLVLATTPSGIFRRLLPELAELAPEYDAQLDRVRYQWATVLVLALDRPLSDIYWLTMTDDDCPFVAAVEQTNFRSPDEYGAQHVLYLSNYADPDDPIVEADADTVLDSYEPYLRRINPDFDQSWVRGRWLFKDRAGQPIVDYRYHESIPAHRTPIKGLWLANTTQIYPEDRGQNYSIRMGRQVARMALEAPAAAPVSGGGDTSVAH
jgi:protoporphyrinogen oxidase